MSAPAAIDPFAPTRSGVYRDDLVEVRARRGASVLRPGATRTPTFDVEHVGHRLRVTHRLLPEQVDDDLSGRLATELFGPGWLRGSDLFERLFTGVVLTTSPDPLACWLLFYRNTLARVEAALAAAPAPGAPHGSIAEYAPVYGHAERLLAPGSVLELGCCFGFLSLRLAARGRRVTASDVDPGTVHLLAAVAERLGVRLETQVADAAAYPGADGLADTVILVHLLEHVDADAGARMVAEAVRLARRRVVVAVPLEDEADETWGHVRTVALSDLEDLGRGSGLAHEVHECHGGWLVLDLV